MINVSIPRFNSQGVASYSCDLCCSGGGKLLLIIGCTSNALSQLYHTHIRWVQMSSAKFYINFHVIKPDRLGVFGGLADLGFLTRVENKVLWVWTKLSCISSSRGALGWKFNLAAPLLSTPVTCESELEAYSGIYTAWPPKKSHTHKLMQFHNIHFSFSLGFRSGLCGGQSMCENDVSHSLNHSFTIWARWIVAFSSWNMSISPGKNISIYGEKKLLFEYTQEINQLHFGANNFTEPRSYQLKQPQIITLPPSTCTGGTRHDGYIPFSPIVMLPSKLKPIFRLA